MRIRAEFCISHGDEMKILEDTILVGDSCLRSIARHKFIYDSMTWHFLKAVDDGKAQRLIGKNAHLVTHPEDRR